MKRLTILFLLTFTWPLSNCVADLVSTGPFTGDKSETFSSFGGGAGGYSSLDIFDGDVTITNLTDGGAVKIEFSSTLIFQGRSDTVVPRSFPVFMGQIGIMEWTFHQPVSAFGGYFENNSFEDDVLFDFYDRNGALIDSVVASNPWAADRWTWNGWESDTPIHRIVSTGNNATLLNGFVWYDDMEIRFSTVPEPGSLTLAGICIFGGLLTCRRTRVRP